MKDLSSILVITFLSYPVWKLLIACGFSAGKINLFGPVFGRGIERLKKTHGIQPLARFPVNAEQKRFEIPFIFSTLAIGMGSVFLNAWVADQGFSRIYSDAREYSLIWLILQPLALLILADAFFYASHRAMHSRLLFRPVHRVHHRSVSLRTLSTASLHPLEAIIQNLIFSSIAVLIPIHEGVLMVTSFLLTGFNFYLHSGVELYPKSFLNTWAGKLLTTSTYHHLHHARGSGNLGVYTRVFDRLFKTEASDYERTFSTHAREDGKAILKLRQLSRLIALLTLTFCWASLLLLMWPLALIAPQFTQKKLQGPLLKGVTRTALKIIGFRIHLRNELPEAKGALIVSNHVSYLDIPVLASLFSTSFITTVEVVGMPFLGALIRRAGCIVIDRRSRANLAAETSEVEAAIDSGVNVMFFPESKATDGTELLIFRRPFFRPACRKKRPVIAVTVNYLSINGTPLTSANRDQIYWYRQNPLKTHIFTLLKQRNVELEVFFEVIPTQPEESADADVSRVAELSRKAVARRWRGIEGSRARLG